MTTEICPGCGERFNCFEGDDLCCTKCLPPEGIVSEPPTAGPPVAVEKLVVKGSVGDGGLDIEGAVSVC